MIKQLIDRDEVLKSIVAFDKKIWWCWILLELNSIIYDLPIESQWIDEDRRIKSIKLIATQAKISINAMLIDLSSEPYFYINQLLDAILKPLPLPPK